MMNETFDRGDAVGASTHAENFMMDALGQRHAPCAGPARIVSLVPSLTELVCDLGLAGQLVGRTGFCIHPKATLRSITKVGGTKDVNIARLRELAPTHVIVTHPCSPEDNVPVYRLLGGIFGCEAEALRLVGELEAAIADARALGDNLPREKVLYLIWREPWMSVARSTYISATLARVGWDTWPPGDEPRYPAFEWNAPWLGDVSRVLLSSEPYSFRDKHLAEVEAASGRPAALIDGEMASWYGSRAVAGLRYLAALRRASAGAE